MSDEKKYYPSKAFQEKAYIKSMEEYQKIYDASIKNPEEFWKEVAKDITWFKPYTSVFEWEDKEKYLYSWFKNGKLNVSYNCLDKHLEKNAEKIALIFQGEEESNVKKYTYKQLHLEVSRFANVLKKHGIKKGDRVSIYMPMIPEFLISLLACARIGAIHSVVFAGYSTQTTKERIEFAKSKMLITADGSLRVGKKINFKEEVSKAIEDIKDIEKILVVKNIDIPLTLKENEYIYQEEVKSLDILDTCEPEEMDSEDPLFILFNSGTVEKPKGTLHTNAGYLVYTKETFKYIFNYHQDDVYWCTADIGWITGHSYLVYGPLANAATVLMYEGIPTFPDNETYWRIIEKHKVNIFYTAPTVIRSLMRYGTDPVKKHDLSSLKLLGSVGEPINPEAWVWYYENIGKSNCPIVDTWWQTESGGFLIAPFPGAFPLKPGFATKPFFGIDADVLREDGSKADVNEPGSVVIKKPWPGMMRTIYGEHQKYLDIYISKYPGYYFCGDRGKIDEDGYFFIIGRMDDVIKVSGHRLGSAEIESALVSNKNVGEAAVVPFPHEIKGQALYAFVILRAGINPSEDLVKELREHVAKEIGPIAKPDKIQFVDSLPKTSSGKIIRRILRAIAYDSEDYGDLSTLYNPEVIEKIKSKKI